MPTKTTIRLREGRNLAVWSYGREDAFPVLYCHGTPSAHGEWEMFGDDALLARHGLRIVAPDRPGMGESTFQPERRCSSWQSDVTVLAEALALDRFAVLGYSGGGAYAVATALALPGRVSAVALVAPVIHASAEMTKGLDPNGLRMKEMARTRPALARLMLALSMGFPARYAHWFLRQQIRQSLPETDLAALFEGDRLDRFFDTLCDAFRQGAIGPTQEMGLMASPWDIDLAAPGMPVAIWQGEEDSFGARPAMARYIAEGLATGNLHLHPDGHISILTRHVDEILSFLAPERKERP
jgi:pimeloyl-ACP methyl ester carboxylesterase